MKKFRSLCAAVALLPLLLSEAIAQAPPTSDEASAPETAEGPAADKPSTSPTPSPQATAEGPAADRPSASPTPSPQATAEAPIETPPPQVLEATQRYDRGLKLYSDGDYELAAIEFEKAYALVPNYRALFNIGQVRLQLGDYALAYRAFSAYLEQGAEEIAPGRRQAVEHDLEMLRSRVGLLGIQINVAGARVSVDQVFVGESPLKEPLYVKAGRHTISVSKPGFYPQNQQVTVAGREERAVSVELLQVPKESSRVIVKQVTESNHEVWKWGAWSATGVFAVAWGVTGGLGIAAADDLDTRRSQAGATRSELDSASRRASTLLLSADILGGLTLLSGGVATYLTLWGDPKDTGSRPEQSGDTSLQVQALPTGIQLYKRF